MPDYQKAKIYKIWSPSKNLFYYGSTTQTLAQRLAKHLSNYKYYTKDNTKTSYMTSFLILECEDYKIELIEDYPCNNKEQLHKKEGEYIKNNECVNMVVAGRGNKEYYQDNIDKIKEKKINTSKIYYENNKEEIKQKSLKYHYDNIDKIKECKKKYRDDNRDEINERRRQNYLKQKELKDKL